MRSGSRCGDRGAGPSAPVLALLRDDEGGFTTVAVALSMLLSLVLVFSAASASWISSRSSEVQRVADAAALAGQNAVAAYSTIVQVIDSCALSMGLAGVTVYGAGLVASCVPGLTSVGLELCSAGRSILEARNGFARSAAAGIERLEATLPLLVVANSASCVAANSDGGVSYTGCALPFPTTSLSDFSALGNEVDDAGMDELSGQMREASERAEEASARADEALWRGWEADCGSVPYSLWERADTLAGLSAGENPRYSSVHEWNFGAPLQRARAYYAARLAAECPEGQSVEELTDSACRRAFYAYALGEVRAGFYREDASGSVSLDLPRLPRNADETRATALYTDPSWPCTQEESGRTLHCSPECPGATGPADGTASLAQLDARTVLLCTTCHMDVSDLGRVAAASTSIENGFEYHWSRVVDAAEDYERARADVAEAQSQTRELAEKGEGLFSQALGQLSSTQVTLCPPGAWGCVSVVARADGTTVPSELTRAFLSSAELPAGAAVSAAVLAPDESTEEANVLSSFLDSHSARDPVLGGALDGVLETWGSLLVGYSSAYDNVAEVGGEFLDGLDGVLGGSVGSWLRERLKGALRDVGLQPVDLRLRKPVLTNSRDVLDQAGLDQVQTVRELVSALPDATSALDLARELGLRLVNEVGGGEFTIAELPLPGTGSSLPVTVDLLGLGGVP